MSDTTNDTTRDDFLAKLDGFGEAVRSMREEAAACCGIRLFVGLALRAVGRSGTSRSARCANLWYN